MRFNFAKRLRVVTKYFEKNLKYHKNKFEALRLEASLEGIFATKLTMRRIINKWQETSSVCHKTSMAGVLAHKKISKREMINLNGLVLEDKEVTGVSCKNTLGLLRIIFYKQLFFFIAKKLIFSKICLLIQINI